MSSTLPARRRLIRIIRQTDMPMVNPEQVKADSISLLRSWAVPVIDHLPTLEAASELSPQSADAVARRCSVLTHVIMIGYDEEPTESAKAVTRFGLMSFASAHERDLFGRKKNSKQERIDATWLTECMQSFAWCLSLAELDVFKHCDDDLASLFPEPYTDPSTFISSAALRPFEEIYRQADIHYRLHWAARNCRHSGAKFPVSESIIRERRRALDWVIGVELDWDEVPSDT